MGDLDDPANGLGGVGLESDGWDAPGADQVKDVTGMNGIDSSLATVEQSYEQLCKAHVEAYLKSAESYLTSSNLSRRVLEWQEKLLPILEEEEQHGPYDIKHYGRDILHTIDVKKNVDDAIDFEQAVQGQPKFEICRMFLAALQLVRTKINTTTFL